ncbi:GNAT family N-acetyltransferase [Brevibacillus humidisoli]|uniref:GNAT family N-acetyltransferase n=1 Tax=Brevibacillus humidisoli TaxID=2895522 RepID=UPI003B96E13F
MQLHLNETGTIIGQCTFMIIGNDCEMISLDSTEENRGIGTALMQLIEKEAIRKNEPKVRGCTSRILSSNKAPPSLKKRRRFVVFRTPQPPLAQ